jgi:CCR4-NOT transcription complex subunit 2
METRNKKGRSARDRYGRFTLNFSDDREFPSLSGAPQAQQNTSAQQMWSNPTLRTAAQSTTPRPQGQTPVQGQASQSSGAPHQQLQSQSHDDGTGSGQGQFGAAGDDYRFGGQAGVGQLSGGGQPQTGNIEEFPPLGGGAGDIGPDRRTGMIQSAAAYGSNANTNAFPGLGQTRNGLSSPTDGQADRSLNNALSSRGILPGGRAPFEGMRGNTTGLQDVRALYAIRTNNANVVK